MVDITPRTVFSSPPDRRLLAQLTQDPKLIRYLENLWNDSTQTQPENFELLLGLIVNAAEVAGAAQGTANIDAQAIQELALAIQGLDTPAAAIKMLGLLVGDVSAVVQAPDQAIQALQRDVDELENLIAEIRPAIQPTFPVPTPQLNGFPAALFGDSITALGEYIPTMIARTGLRVINNSAVPGATAASTLAQITAPNVAGAGVINIWVGINDYFQSTALGTISDAAPAGASTFYKHIWQLLNQAMTLNPTAKVHLISPMKSTYNPGGFTYPGANLSGVTLDQYRVAMRNVSDLMGSSFIDMFAKSHFTIYNMAIYTPDSIHPNALGGVVAGTALASLLNGG